MQNLGAQDFYQETHFNPETKNQIWMSQIADSHDNICCCSHPFAHLISSIFPPGHKDRGLTIDQILTRDFKEKCLSGGDAGGSPGLADGRGGGDLPDIKGEEEEYPEDEVEKLIAAAEGAATR